MRNKHMDRSAGYSGIAFIVITIAAFIIQGFPPSQAPSAVADFIASRQTMWLVGAWLTLPGVALLLWFASGLNDYLRDAEGMEATLLRWAFAGALIGGMMAVLSAVVAVVMAYHPLAVALATPLFDLSGMLATLGFFPSAWWIWGVSNCARRQGRWPMWVIWLGFLAALLSAAASLAGIFAGTPLAFTLGQGIVSFVWIVVVSVILIRAHGEGP